MGSLCAAKSSLAAGREQSSLSEVVQDPAALGSFLGGFAGKMIFLSLICILVIVFLRVLFGPKGFFREKRWDEMNEEFRASEQEKVKIKRAKRIYKQRRETLVPIVDKEIRAFSAYVEKFYTGNAENDRLVGLKAQHSANVLKNAWFIAAREEAFYDAKVAKGAPRPDHALLLAALYHDTGRFEQLRQYGTFKDKDSINHGLMGSRVLADERFMSGANPDIRKLVRGAALLHNRFHLPQNLPEPLGLVLKGVRDADKLDIIRVMGQEFTAEKPDPTVVLGLVDEPESYSRKVLEAILHGNCVNYQDMRTVNDFRLLVCSWVATLEFTTTKTLLDQRGYLWPVLDTLPHNPDMNKVRDAVTRALKS